MSETKKRRPFEGAMKALSGQFRNTGKGEAAVTETEKLSLQIHSMEEELNGLRALRAQYEQIEKQNEKLTAALVAIRGQVEAMKKEVERLSAPPSSYAIFSRTNTDGTADVYIGGRKMKVNLHPNLSSKEIKKGQQVVLNETLNVIEVGEIDKQGEIVHLKDLLGDSRAVVEMRSDEQRVVELADSLKDISLVVGDALLFDTRSGYVLEKLPRSEVQDVVLEEVPDVTYAHIGGLDAQIAMVREAIEAPLLYSELYAEHRLRPTKGVLLYGPPGCGKTLIAKAVAASVADRLHHLSGQEVRSFFLHIKGPELLNKYVGETERQLREVFKKARERASEGHPVIIFFDEMDSLFRTRGTGVSSDMEATVVPQFLSEMDGVESLRNVIVIGATNRQDLLDPAILRSGRLDVRIKIGRPDPAGAEAIFRQYLTSDLPYHAETMKAARGDAAAAAAYCIREAVDFMYSTKEENRFLEVTYADGGKEIFYFKDFVSGAMIEGVASRAKRRAVKRLIETGVKGIQVGDLTDAIQEEFKENEDLPNTTNPDDWAKIAGRRGEKIAHIRTMAGSDGPDTKRIETVMTGHYL